MLPVGNSKLRVLLADDHEILRAGLRTLLETYADLDIVGEAATGTDAVRMARQLNPAIVIMDVGMPELNGIEATRKILKYLPECMVLGLSMHSDHRFVRQMLEAGAGGYLLKDCALEEIGFAIKALRRKQTYLSPKIAGHFINRDHFRPLEAPEYESVLSPREREVLQHIAEGHSTADIAARLHLSVKTVESHRKHIMDKLDLRSVAALTKYAIRAGLTTL
jgi:DNA-binding NarL/FixJ family response regulator